MNQPTRRAFLATAAVAAFGKSRPVRSPNVIFILTDDQLYSGDRAGETELYDPSKDPGEHNNIAAQNPAIVTHLRKEYEDWYKRLPRD